MTTELETIIPNYLPLLQALPPDQYAHKASPAKWSKKEILGHLVDSAQNNIRRFIAAQYEEAPTIVYNQDKWVAANDYQHYEIPGLIQLWYLLNKQITVILKNMPAALSQRLCQTPAPHTVEWLAEDYIKHLKHHLHQILNLSPVSYP